MTRCICSTAYVFRQLVKARLAYPVSKSATVEYLKNHFDEDVSL